MSQTIPKFLKINFHMIRAHIPKKIKKNHNGIAQQVLSSVSIMKIKVNTPFVEIIDADDSLIHMQSIYMQK